MARSKHGDLSRSLVSHGFGTVQASTPRSAKLLSIKVKRRMQDGVASTKDCIAPFGLGGNEFRVSYCSDGLPCNGFRHDTILSVAIGWHLHEPIQPMTRRSLQRGLPRDHARVEEDCRCVTHSSSL
jgi:hypothetical protein